MPINDIRREHVLQAIEKCDECGRDEFLEKCGFRKAKSTWLVHNGRNYDSKAIIAVAHGYARPDLGPLTSSDFSGGEPVKTKLERLGFRVDHTGDDQNSPWTAPREAVDEKPASLRRDDETDFASSHISFPNGRQDDESILADSRTPVSASGLREPDSPGKAAADMKPEATVTRTAGTQSGTSFPSVEEYAAQAFFFKVSLQHSYKDGFPVSPFCVYCKRKRRVGLLYKDLSEKDNLLLCPAIMFVRSFVVDFNLFNFGEY